MLSTIDESYVQNNRIDTIDKSRMPYQFHFDPKDKSKFIQDLKSARRYWFGPFEVVDAYHAILVEPTDTNSPGWLASMLRSYPNIRIIEMLNCAGTVDDTANLKLGRMIRARGIDTLIPPGGSVRSGAVDLFLAGNVRYAAPNAEFAVHSWIDQYGREPRDYSPKSAANVLYVNYYQAMGMSREQAERFYELTNSVSHTHVLRLHKPDIARFIAVN